MVTGLLREAGLPREAGLLREAGLIFIFFYSIAEELTPLLLEHTSGGCNILHVLSILGRPPVPSRSPSPYSGMERRSVAARTTPRSGVLREIMKQAMALATSSGPAHGLGD